MIDEKISWADFDRQVPGHEELSEYEQLEVRSSLWRKFVTHVKDG